jgi:uncharacterized protein (DUF3820 family)
MSDVTVRPRNRQGPAPGQSSLPFGRFKGQRLRDVPVDYLAQLRKAPWLWPATRDALCTFLAWLARHPGEARLPFGKHEGEALSDVETSYLDWALGQDWLQGYHATSWLIAAELRKRSGTVLVYVDPFGPPVGRIDRLHEIEDREPFDTRVFVPTERLSGAPGRRSWRSLVRRPREAAQAEDEAVNQRLGLPPMHELFERQARNRVYWARTEEDGFVIKGDDDATDADRLRSWDRALEGLDRLGGAQDLNHLDLLYAKGRAQVELLALAEGWDIGSNQLLDELDEAYRRRHDALLRQEVTFTDADHRVEGQEEGEEAAPRRRKGRSRGEGVVDLEPARAHEVVRRMRGCRTLEQLADVGFWVARHRDEFREETLAKLRNWFSFFRAELTAG